MNTRHDTPIPDSKMLTPELHMRDVWDARAVSELIRSKCRFGETPAFLFVGRREAALLRQHLAEAFGSESVTTLHQTYYMGLEVVEIGSDNFLFTAGRKAIRTLQDPIARRPQWRDRETEAMWQLRI
ncbi:hypothetical protein OKA04_10030 [Luteolibacter flavescens]|uniref:Uncharacterized protein n=1 Tax=Luteolibacter flavescens TaxID=1859460 RepID=A0ABT3FNC3_9BACT|nr:hypothetical protein [Luteolibacter flavescens]MCW1885065.1 hypothetical protein [Luteolibacter flavescens]